MQTVEPTSAAEVACGLPDSGSCRRSRPRASLSSPSERLSLKKKREETGSTENSIPTSMTVPRVLTLHTLPSICKGGN